MRRVVPGLIGDPLVNPNMGFTTFQRFNGDELFPGQTWSEFGPEEFPHAGEPPAAPGERPEPAPGFPDTTIAYCRWYWATLNPEPEAVRFDIVENACRSAAARGQQLDLRIMPHNGEVTVPEWYRGTAAGGPAAGPELEEWAADPASPPPGGAAGKWLPDYEDPAYLERFGGLVRRLGERFDGDPRINMIDVAMFGHWGEWHRSDGRMGPPELWERGIDLFLEAWPTTRKAVLIADKPRMRYACERGCGWRLDCWGDMGGFSPEWNHMTDFYNQALCRAGTTEAWRTGPVSLETCWVMGKWFDQGWDADYIVDQALRWHVTSINLKSSRVPDEYRPQIERLLRGMGYRMALRRILFSEEVPRGGPLRVQATWENLGVAPPYAGYPAALALAAGGEQHVLTLAESTAGWLPGPHHVERELKLPESLAPRRYRLRAALLSPHDGRPRVRLANAGRADDGWYELGEVEVTR